MTPPRSPKLPVQMRSLIIIALLIALVAFGSMLGRKSKLDMVIEKRAEEVCGEGNVKRVSKTTFECGTSEEPDAAPEEDN